MISRVGNDMPSDAQWDSWAAKLDALRAEMMPYIIKLDASAKRHLLAMRPGGEPMVALIATLAVKYNVSIPDMPVAGMQNDLTLSQRLAPMDSESLLLSGFFKDTIYTAKSEAWQAAMGNYSILARIAEGNPALHAELSPVREFMKTHPVEPAAAPAAPPGSPAPGTNTP